MTKTTEDVIDRFDRAFQAAPDGTRHEGYGELTNR